MKPRTDNEKRILALSKKLRPITQKHERWAFEKLFDKHVVRSRSKLYCLECGHSWKDSESILATRLLGCTCPECGAKLKEKQNYRPYYWDAEYFAILTTKCGYQLIRMVYVKRMLKKGKKAEFFAHEVMQYWIDQAGCVTWLHIAVNGFSQYFDQWVFGSEMEIRNQSGSYKSSSRFNLVPYKIYPGGSVISIMKRNGFRGRTYNLSPVDLFVLLITNKQAETLFKAGQIDIIRYYSGQHRNFNSPEWPSIKICIRNGYIIKDASMWVDYLRLLKYFGKDVRNAKYVCPANLVKEQ